MKYLGLGALCLITGCSLINSLDKVKQQPDDSGAGTGGKGGKGTGGGKMMETDAGSGATSGSGGLGGTGGVGGSSTGGAAGLEAGIDASEGGSGGDGGQGGSSATDGGDAGDAGSFTPGGPGGAIVVYDPTNKKLLVLDPQNGKLVSSELSLRILAVANDPITDNWYIVQQPGAVTDPAELQIRQLNTTTGKWHLLGKPVKVPNPAVPSLGVLNRRLVYLSTPDPKNADQTTSQLAVIDTTVPALAVQLGAPRTLPAGIKLALIPNPDGAHTGGSITVVLQQSACGAIQCDMSVIRETINDTTVGEEPGGPKLIGEVSPAGGSIGFAYDLQHRYDVIIAPPLTLPVGTNPNCTQNQGVNGTVAEYDPATHSPLVGPYNFDIASLRVSGATFDPCHQIAFATSLLADTAVWAIPMAAGGTPSKLCTQGGGVMLFEPYTHGIIRIPIAGDRIEEYDINETTLTAPTLAERNLKLPTPFSVTTQVIAVRQPLTGFCN